jgi:hypothetical protein
MYITDEEPVAVNARAIPFTERIRKQLHVKRNDVSSVMLCQLPSGALFTVNGGASSLPGHGNWYRVHGETGLMENLREHGLQHKLRLTFNDWEVPPGYAQEQVYPPDFPVLAEEARRAGHGGGDFYTMYYFAEAIRSGGQPWLDVYRGLIMTAVGIQSWRSCLDEGRPYPIPDWRSEEARQAYEDDHWSPFPEHAGPGQPPPSIEGFHEPSPTQLREAREYWAEHDITPDD